MSNDKGESAIVAQRLNDALEFRKMSAAQLSRATGIDQAAISRYRQGLYAPKRKAIFNIARALMVNPTWLLGYSDEMISELSQKDRARNELENLIEDMDLEQIEKTLRFVRDYIVK